FHLLTLKIPTRPMAFGMLLRTILIMLGGKQPENYVTVRYMFIVSRAHLWLYRHLAERFDDDRDVSVVLDRRIGERRREPFKPELSREGRQGQRRQPVAAENDLQLHSHYIVEI